MGVTNHFVEEELGKLYLNSQKQGPFRMSGLFVRPILDYLERNEWIEIIRRSRTTNILPLPLHSVFFMETIQTNRKKYELKTKPEYLLLMHFGLLFFSILMNQLKQDKRLTLMLTFAPITDVVQICVC